MAIEPVMATFEQATAAPGSAGNIVRDTNAATSATREALHRDAAQLRGGFWYRLSQAVMRRGGGST